MTQEELVEIIEVFIQDAENELIARWDAWEKDLSRREIYEVIGGLLARQVSLATNIADSPSIWNGHVAPIIHRAMADVYITLAWILEDPKKRSQRFIYYGLGQQKLQIEHKKKQAERDGLDPKNDPYIMAGEEWINSQQYTFLTEVNVGSWSELNTRKMAEEADCVDFYNRVYSPFSAAVHSMWHYIEPYNLRICANPLHQHHRIPDTQKNISLGLNALYLAAECLDKAFRRFDEKMDITVESPNSFQRLCDKISEPTDE